MGRNLTNLNISSSFQHLLQISSSNTVNDGTGSLITDLDITASNATSASYAVTASYALNATLDTGSLLTTASNDFSEITFTKGDGSTFLLDTSPREVIETVINKNGFMAKGTPVYVSGSTGNSLHVYAASASRADRMPATFVLNQDLNNGEEGEAILAGFINGVNTSTFQAGDNVYVGVNGGYTNVKPTGSANFIQKLGNVIKSAVNGSGVISGAGRSNDLPNLTTNYVWKGDSNGVPQAVAQSSLSVGTATSASYVAGANVDGTVASATSASRATSAASADNATTASYVAGGNVDGAVANANTASVVTDPNVAYTNVNNSFTGTQTFDNIAVNGTGSFAYIQSVTGSAKVIGDAFLILNNNLPAERYAGIKVLDSGSTANSASLVWDGQTNDWFYEFSSSATHEYGVVMMGPEYSTQGSPTYPSSNTLVKGNGGHHLIDTNITDDGSKVAINSTLVVTGSGASQISGSTGGLKVTTDWPGNFQVDKTLVIDGFTNGNGNTYYGEVRHQNYGSFNTNLEGIVTLFSEGPNFGGNYYTSYKIGPTLHELHVQPTGSALISKIELEDIGGGATEGRFEANAIKIGNTSATNTVQVGSVNVATSSMFADYIDVGGAATVRASVFGQTTLVGTTGCDIMLLGNNAATSSLLGDDINIGSSGNTSFVDIEGTEITTTGRVKGGVNTLSIASTTASLDAQTGNYFDLTLVSGSNTHVTVSNIAAGQTYILKTTQPGTGTGTITFNSEFKFSAGAAPTATGASNAVDVYTFVSYDSSDVLSTQVTDLK